LVILQSCITHRDRNELRNMHSLPVVARPTLIDTLNYTELFTYRIPLLNLTITLTYVLNASLARARPAVLGPFTYRNKICSFMHITKITTEYVTISYYRDQ